jgi:hypothetical protein
MLEALVNSSTSPGVKIRLFALGVSMNLQIRCALVLALAAFLVSNFSCARDQELTSIEIAPPKQAFGASNIPVSDNAGLSVQLRALGHYIHPPVTKDITDQVNWTVNNTQMFTMGSTGLITATGNVCGGALVFATVNTGHDATGRSSSGAVVTAQAEADVICFTSTGGGSGALLTVQFAGGGNGTVVSTPPGINCASNNPACSATFSTGTAINVTATPGSTSSFGGWLNCDSVSGQTCIINTLTANRTITATFN